MLDQNNQPNFQRGVAALVILGLLKQEDMYGYQLVQEMERQSSGALMMKEGSLYPVLYKLEEAGFITSERRIVGKRMVRVYYHAEPSGLAYLEKLTAEYRAVTGGVFHILEGERT